jgi:hypothetical protein
MALYDSLYNLDQAYSPFTNNMIRPSGQKQGDFGKTQIGLGLSSLMSPQLQPGITSPFKKGDESLNQRPEGFISPMGGATMALEDYINPSTGETWTASSGGWTAPEGWVVKRFLDQYGLEEATRRATEQRAKPRDYLEEVLPNPQPKSMLDTWLPPQPQPDLGLRPTVTLPSASPFLNTRPGDEGAPPMPPQQTINTSDGPMLPPTPMPNPPVSLPRPTTMPMPGDVGYVPYGSRNNQLVPPGYEKPSFVQGLAGGGPVGNLSFVELLQQIMEN